VEDSKFLRLAVGVTLLFIAMFVLKAARSVIFPFILAVFMSYVIDPIMVFLMRFKIPKAAAVALILFGAFIIFYLIGAVVFSSGKTLAAELPRFEQRLTDLTAALERGLGGLPLRLRVASFVEKINLQSMAALVMGALGPFVGLVSKLFLLFVFLAFIVAGRGRATAKVEKFLSPSVSKQVMDALDNINAQVRRYLGIKTLMSLINGLTVWAVLALFGVDFALLFGFLAFLLNFIPNIGSLVAAILRVGFAFFQFGTIWVPLWILIITVGLDVMMGNFVEPRIMGKGLGISPLVVFFSLVFWAWLWGIPGMIMAVPLVAVAKIVCQNVPALRPIAILMDEKAPREGIRSA
jgi:predicted PurR-regulated permease PerM